MELRADQQEQLVSRWADWRDWRSLAAKAGPTAGSVATHVAVGLGLAALLAGAEPMRQGASFGIELSLVTEAAPPVGIVATPPDAGRAPLARAERDEEALLEKPEPKAPPREQEVDAAVAPGISGGAPTEERGGVYAGTSQVARSGVALGLRTLLETNPCDPPGGRPRGDCSFDWVDLMEKGDASVSPSYDRLAQLYPGFRLPDREQEFRPRRTQREATEDERGQP